MTDEEFNSARLGDGSLNLVKLFELHFGEPPSDFALTYMADIVRVRRIAGRQAAAMIISTAHTLEEMYS